MAQQSIGPADVDSASNFEVVGKAAWLFCHSDLHHEWSYASLKRWIIPAILHKQYRLFEQDDFPVAWLSWGWFSDDAIRQYLSNPDSLQPAQWQSGKHLWFIDYCAPWGHTHHVKRELKQGIFKGHSAHFLRVRAGETKARVATLRG